MSRAGGEIVSIIIPNFNKGKFVEETVGCILAQTSPDWELIFIDDGSTDPSFEWAKAAAKNDERCVFLKNTSGIKGANAARNQGIEMARGKYILFLDSDDLLAKDSIENRLKDFSRYPNNALLIYPTGVFFDTVGDSDLICNIPNEKSFLHRFLERDITWLISGPIWKKETLEKLNGFDLRLQSQQDYDLHVRALIAGFDFKYFHQEPDAHYRRNVGSIPRIESQSVVHFEQRFEMILRHHALLKEAGKLGATEKRLLATYLLDIAQMMRWHKVKLGRESKTRADVIWSKALSLELVDRADFKIGQKYINFKHQMLFNRFPKWQAKKEESYRQKLGSLIFEPSLTYCQVRLSDYES